MGQAANNTVTVTGYTAGTTGTNTFTANPAGPIANAALGKVTVVATLEDRYATAIASGAVTATVTGRNTVAATPLVTNADGQVTFSYTDAGTSTANDTITFASSVGTTTSKTVTVTYGNAAVSTVAVTSSNTTLGVAKATVTPLAISAGDGAEGGAVDVTATVKDANGNLLSGVAVTWTISGTGAAVTTTTATSYTTSAGLATASIFAWMAGTYTVTATAGGKTGTGTTTWSSQTAGNARVLSASVEGNVVTAKVVDRFGNPVKNVLVYATKSGVGYFGTGYGSTSGTTLADGTTQFNIIGGDASVTVSTLDPTSAAGTNAAGQTCALAGNVDCASGATAAVAFTAAVAGDSLNDAEYVGSTYAPAGVSSATVSVTDAASSNASAAADAAAEATDAANAATDAANAAAEAADAATAAAQDAADAVAALSAQVASLISGLKAQLTALTNLVIKIQKKVKA
jgi:protocatechuate 3,4-dioxygenase beta subunit